MSSKNIRKHQPESQRSLCFSFGDRAVSICAPRTTLGSFLCSALRDEMQVDCVLFDGGNIRGAIAACIAARATRSSATRVLSGGAKAKALRHMRHGS